MVRDPISVQVARIADEYLAIANSIREKDKATALEISKRAERLHRQSHALEVRGARKTRDERNDWLAWYLRTHGDTPKMVKP